MRLIHARRLVIPLPRDLLDRRGELRVILQDAVEVGFIQHEQVAQCLGPHGGRPQFGKHQRDFAEAIAVAQSGYNVPSSSSTSTSPRQIKNISVPTSPLRMITSPADAARGRSAMPTWLRNSGSPPRNSGRARAFRG